MKMKKTILLFTVMAVFGTVIFAQNQPEWIQNHLKYGRETYENKTVNDETKWTYSVGVSNLLTSESRSRKKAEQALQESIATNVAGQLTKNLDLYVFSEYADDDSIPEEALIRYEEALNLAVSVRVPKVEFLEYYTEKETVEGKKSYKTYVLGRYLTSELREYVEKIDVKAAVEDATKKIEKSENVTIPEDLMLLVTTNIEEEVVEYVEDLSE